MPDKQCARNSPLGWTPAPTTGWRSSHGSACEWGVNCPGLRSLLVLGEAKPPPPPPPPLMSRVSVKSFVAQAAVLSMPILGPTGSSSDGPAVAWAKRTAGVMLPQLPLPLPLLLILLLLRQVVTAAVEKGSHRPPVATVPLPLADDLAYALAR